MTDNIYEDEDIEIEFEAMQSFVEHDVEYSGKKTKITEEDRKVMTSISIEDFVSGGEKKEELKETPKQKTEEELVADIAKKYHIEESLLKKRLGGYVDLAKKAHKITSSEIETEDITKAIKFKRLKDEEELIENSIEKIIEKMLKNMQDDQTLPIIKKTDRYTEMYSRQFILEFNALINSWDDTIKSSPETILKNEHLSDFFSIYDIVSMRVDIEPLLGRLKNEKSFDTYLKLLEVYYQDGKKQNVFENLRKHMEENNIQINIDSFFLM